MKYFRLVILVFLVAFLASCGGPFNRLTKPEYTNEKLGYHTQLPVGWVQYTGPELKDEVMLSKDGYSLQSIRINRLAKNLAFEKTKQVPAETVLISDLAEYELAEFKAKSPNSASIKVLENTLTKVDENPAFKLHLQYLNDRGLRLEDLIIGLMHNDYYYRLSYYAPTLYYFERDEPIFEQVVSDFQFNSK